MKYSFLIYMIYREDKVVDHLKNVMKINICE